MTTPESSYGPTDQNEPDADDLQALARSLDARRDRLDEFARMAAHDLRAPLRSIEAFTRLAIETEDAGETDALLERALRAAVRMRSLLDSLLEFADSGRFGGEMSLVPLAEVVDDAVADLAADFEEVDGDIDIGMLPSVRCDPTQLRRLFVNVLSNSLTYSADRRPEITIRATELGSDVLITVSDNGEGFAQELSEAVFEPFRRASAKGSGQGLGLAICKRIAEIHGGNIRADSEPERGTTIFITLPKPANPAG